MSENRKLATIDLITAIESIPGADFIELARVRGWQVVVKRGLHHPGDTVVFFEIDSFLDTKDPRFEFLATQGIKTDQNAKAGHVLKTRRLKGKYSQGLIIPISEFPEISDLTLGSDVTEIIGVTLWEPPIPVHLSGQVRGPRPHWIPKTDEERIQNLPPEIFDYLDTDWLPSEKIDGSSTSIFVQADGDYGVCSRNLSLFETENNILWQLARKYDLFGIERHFVFQHGIAIQGEVFGEGIQKNPLKIKGQRFRAFNIIVDGISIPRIEWPVSVLEMSVPIYQDLEIPKTLAQALSQVEDLKSFINPEVCAEGIVWRHQYKTHIEPLQIRASFKCISNNLLARQKD